MPRKTFNVGILGGCFDPIHQGHLLIAQEARRQCDLARVLFCPYRNSPREEDRELAGQETRMLMVELAVKDVPAFQVSLTEMEREGPSYTVDTLEQIKEKNPEWNLHFIIGSDNLKEFHKWKKPGNILDVATLFVALRDENPRTVPKPVKKLIKKKGSDRLVFQSDDSPRFSVSSTMIRNRCRNRDPINFLVPESVQEYIENHELYKERQKL